MKILKLTSLLIILIGLAYIAYGAFSIYFASLNVADLPANISNDINATGATWEEWKKAFFRGGVYAIGMGIVTLTTGIGIFKAKNWGRTLWIFLSPILLLNQFLEGQKSLIYFKTWGAYQLAWFLLIIIALTWLMLFLPSSRRQLAKTTEHLP